MIHIVNGDAYI